MRTEGAGLGEGNADPRRARARLRLPRVGVEVNARGVRGRGGRTRRVNAQV